MCRLNKFISDFRFQLLIVTVLLCFLSYLFPYTGDDWAWGTEVGIDRLNTWFSNYNGRYFGNILVLIFSRSLILKSLFMGIINVLLCYNIYIFINKNNKKIFWLSLLFLLLTPKLISAQTLVWLSGYTNYVVPTLLILIYLNLFRYIFEGDFSPNKRTYMFAFPLGFLNSLIMENISLYNIAISLIFLVYTYIKYRKIDYAQILFLLSCIFGTIIMFSNEAYSSIASNQDDYRSMAVEGGRFLSIINLYFDKMNKMFFLNNKIIIVFISIFGVLSFNKVKSESKNNTVLMYIALSSFVLIAYAFYQIMITITPNWHILLKYTKYIEGIATVIWCFSLLFLTTIKFKESSILRKAFVAEMSFVILFAPLFFVTPVWYRNVFPLYIMLVVIGLALFEYSGAVLSLKIIVWTTLLSYLYMLSIYGYVYISEQRRIDTINEKKYNVDTLVIKKLPYRDYLWMTEPKGKMWEDRFKLFYDIPKDVKLKFINK